MFEVHLFAIPPILLAWRVALRPNPGPWVRATVLALLLGTTLLVRLETLIAAGCFFVICAIHECRCLRTDLSLSKLARVIVANLVPLAILCGIVLWFCSRSTMGFEDARFMLRGKETATAGQWFAFGFQHRHPEWTGSPWSDYPALETRVFGACDLTPIGMIRKNPREFFAHVLWNFSMTPAALQLSFFNCAAGNVDFDINPLLKYGSPMAWVWTALLGAILGSGFLLGWREREKWKGWLARRKLGWMAMLSVVIGAPFILITSPPRPEIFLCDTICLMAVVGMAAMIISNRFHQPAWSGAIIPIVLIAALIFTPRHFPKTGHQLPPLAEVYERLRPYESLINTSENVCLQSRPEINFYIGHNSGRMPAYQDFHLIRGEGEPLAAALDRQGVTLFYLDRRGVWLFGKQHTEALRQFINEPGKWGWRVVHDENTTHAKWTLFQRETSHTL
jgi:hypothetical protein